MPCIHSSSGQNSPKELAALRTTRTLQNLGRAAIYSSSPYIDSAIETLIPPESLGPTSPAAAAAMYTMMAPTTSAPNGISSSSLAGVIMSSIAEGRPLFGRLPKRGSKASAMQRARRAVSAGAPFRSEVPFADAVRIDMASLGPVCYMYSDRLSCMLVSSAL